MGKPNNTVKPRVLYYALESEDAFTGLPNFGEKILSEHFDLMSVSQVEQDPGLAETIEGCIVIGRKWLSALKNLLLGENLKSLKVVCNFGAGYNHLVDYLNNFKERGIQVGYLPDAVTRATADFAWALLLASARDIVPAVEEATGPKHSEGFRLHERLGADVCGATLGIVGMGRIGYQVARRAQGFDMKILYHNRTQRCEADEIKVGATYCPSLEQMLPQCDFVVISCPLTKDTHHLFDANMLSNMKSSATLINVARGGVVDTNALVETLGMKKIRGAALDVTDPEPLPQQHPLLNLGNALITSHKGSCTKGSRYQMWQEVCDTLRAVLIYKEDVPTRNRLI